MGWGVMGNGGVGNGRVVGTALEGGRMIVVTRKHHCVHRRSTAFMDAALRSWKLLEALRQSSEGLA